MKRLLILLFFLYPFLSNAQIEKVNGQYLYQLTVQWKGKMALQAQKGTAIIFEFHLNKAA